MAACRERLLNAGRIVVFILIIGAVIVLKTLENTHIK